MTDQPEANELGETQRRAAAYWNEHHNQPAPDHDNFLNHPFVQAYVSLRAFGSLVGHMDVVLAELRNRTNPGDCILSVGCGAARKERTLARKLPDRHFVGLDIAEEALAATAKLIEEDGLQNLELGFGDFNNLELEENRYRVVLGLGAVHHVEELETFWAACAKGLTADGSVLAQEYVGPDRFQWTDEQLEASNRVLSEIIPREHLVHHETCERPAIDYMLKVDPSEAVRSSEIVSTCEAAGFTFDGYTGAGCALLQPVLSGQIETFDPANWSHNRILTQLFEVEDQLMREGRLQDDFAMFVAKPPQG